MTKTSRARYTLKFKQEALRLVEGGQTIAAVARTLGVVDQTLLNWVKAHKPRQTHRSGQQARERRADGNQPAQGRAGAREDGA